MDRLKKAFLTFFVMVFTYNMVFSQNDTVKNHHSFLLSSWAYVVPSVMISYGIATRFSSTLQKFDKTLDDMISQNFQRRYTLDDYIQYVPYLGIYGLDLCGIKAKHHFKDRTLVLANSIIICTAATQLTKQLSNVTRPDGSNNHSFPSGHTATAFLGAHILFREYNDISPWIGVAGYGIALTTGSMRMINRKHWFSDVVTGAGVGIISVELSYLMLPVWQKIFKIKPPVNTLIIAPIIGNNFYGAGGVLMF